MQKDDIKKLVGRGETEAALQSLQEDILFAPYENEVTTLAGRFHKVQHDARIGIVDESFVQKEINQINYAILELLSAVERGEKGHLTKKGTPRFNWIWRAGILVLALGIAAFFWQKRRSNPPKTYEFEYVQNGMPDEIVSKIDSLQKAGEMINYLAFGPAPEYREWVAFYGRNHYIHNAISTKLLERLDTVCRFWDGRLNGLYLGKNSSFLVWYNANDFWWYPGVQPDTIPGLLDSLYLYNGQRREIKDISIAADKSWVVLWNRNGYTYRCKEGGTYPFYLHDVSYMKDLELKQIEFSRQDAFDWVLVYDASSFYTGTPDPALQKALYDIQENKQEIMKVFMRRKNEWIVFYK